MCSYPSVRHARAAFTLGGLLLSCSSLAIASPREVFRDEFDGNSGLAVSQSRIETGAGTYAGTALLDGNGSLVAGTSAESFLSYDLTGVDWDRIRTIRLELKIEGQSRGELHVGFQSRDNVAPLADGHGFTIAKGRNLAFFYKLAARDPMGEAAIDLSQPTAVVFEIDLEAEWLTAYVGRQRTVLNSPRPISRDDLARLVIAFAETDARLSEVRLTIEAGAQSRIRGTKSFSPLTHGPMIGRPGSDRMRIWLRTDSPAPFLIRYADSPDATEWKSTEGHTRAEHDNTGFVDLLGLHPATTYYYAVEIAGKTIDSLPMHTGPLSFRTHADGSVFRDPETNPEGKFNLKFGTIVCNHIGGAMESKLYSNIWERHDDLDLLVMNGDYIYEWLRRWVQPRDFHLDTFRADYKGYLALIPEMARVFTRTPSLFTFDDHEIGPENATSAIGYKVDDRTRRQRTQPVLRDFGLAAWHEYVGWGNYDMPDFQELRFGHARLEAGSDRLVDESAKFSTLDTGKTTTLHLHINTRNAGVYAIDEVVNDKTLRLRPAPEQDEAGASYSIGTHHYHDFKIGNSHFFALDTRSNRTRYQTELWSSPEQKLLGDRQMKWLIDGVKNSDAEFIFVISTVPWFVYHNASHVAGRVINIRESDKEDGMSGHLWERNTLLDVFDSLPKPVIILTGDLHSAYAIQAADNVWEFMVSPATSSLHPVESGGNPPFGGWYKPGDRLVKIKWASTFPMKYMAEYRRLPRDMAGFIYGTVRVNNIFPVGVKEDGEVRWMAYETPTVTVELRNTETAEIVYAETISPLDARPQPPMDQVPDN